MKMPEGIPNPYNKVCKLQKSLLGLKQASKQWHSKLADFLKNQRYSQSKNDYSLFLKTSEQHMTMVVVYVDDIFLTGSSTAEIQNLKQQLHPLASRIFDTFIIFWDLRCAIYLMESV